MKEFIINNKVISIFYKETFLKELPVIILNTFNNEGQNVWEKCNDLESNEFILVSIAKMNWNNDLTPWECPPLYKGDSKCLGYADNYLKEIEKDMIPIMEDYITNTLHKKISYYGIAGYSLGGLFALYSGFKTNLFKRIISASGSLWYPNFSEFVKKNKLSDNIDRIYFSLGNKESKSKIKILSTVKEKTEEIYEHISKNINSKYEENEGNHFKEATLRMAKGIKWIIEE